MAAPWMGQALRADGLPVIEEPGCMDRGTGGLFTPLGVLLHHTAGSASGNLPSLRIVRDGRSDLQGPLAQLMLARDGTFHFIAAGRANHAGVGTARFVPNGDGNRYLIGIEAESTGVRDDWTLAQRINYPRGVAALCRWMHVSELNVLGHKEWAPTRKVDPAFWDMNACRAEVRGWLRGSPPPPPPAPIKPKFREEEDTMYVKCELNGPGKGTSTALLCGPIFVGLAGPEAASADANIAKGALVQWIGPATWRELDKRSHALCDNPRPIKICEPDESDDQAA